ncbi:MAG: hypothetical protein Kow0042_22170 [Calditrichia bacterium]
MKKWIVGIIILIIIVGVVYLVEAGIIDWQPLTIIAAAIAGPFKFIMSLLGNEEEKIRKAHEKVRLREAAFQEELGGRIGEREENIRRINAEMEEIESKLEELKKKREMVDRDVGSMSDEELMAEWKKRFGGTP